MTKPVKYIYLIILLALISGCSEKKDVKKDTGILTQNNPRVTNSPPRLDLLEEIYDNMNYETVINKYKDIIPFEASVTRFRYYVIFSELDENTTYNLIDKDIRYTADAMANNYVSDLPDSVTPVFLFNNIDKYKEFSIKYFDISEDDISPFGFYKISKNAIVIRYVSWKGSTSHEITHTFTRYDFPDMPSWFDEGLASLHEKFIYEDGKLTGDFSWRIVALRRAFREKTYTGIRTMMETNDNELYGKRSSFYYAQSRYLLMYIQKIGVLEEFYRLFRDTYDDDNTGITQLEKVTNKSVKEIDIELTDYIKSFKQEW